MGLAQGSLKLRFKGLRTATCVVEPSGDYTGSEPSGATPHDGDDPSSGVPALGSGGYDPGAPPEHPEHLSVLRRPCASRSYDLRPGGCCCGWIMDGCRKFPIVL